MNKLFNTFTNFLREFPRYLLIVLGLCIFTGFIWMRFIRERLPRDIPLNLNELGFYILLFVCLTYLYTIITLIKPPEMNPYLYKLVEILYKPLIIFDIYLKNNKYFSKIFSKFDYYIKNRTDYTRAAGVLSNKDMNKIYFCYTILPKICIVIFLLIDTFYFNKLNLLYSVIVLGIFPLIHRYVKYELEYMKNESIYALEAFYWEVTIYQENKPYKSSWSPKDERYICPNGNCFAIPIYNCKDISVQQYIQILVDNWYYNSNDEEDEDNIYYYGMVFTTKIYEEIYREKNTIDKDTELTDEDYSEMCKEFNIDVQFPIEIEIFLVSYRMTETKYKKTKLFIYTLYFICWSYILFLSYFKVEVFTVSKFILNFVITIVNSIVNFIMTNAIINEIIIELYPYIESIEPFSGIFLY